MNIHLSEQQIIELNEYLTSLLPGSTISIEATSYNTGIPKLLLEKILISLSDSQILNTLFVLRCDNDNFDFVHTFSFSKFEELIQFVKEHDTLCPECESVFLESNTQVFFLIPPSNLKKVF